MSDEQFDAQGARIVPDADAVFAQAELVLKVKEPQPVEVATAARGPDAVHLPAPGGRAGAGTRADGLGRDVHRV